MWFNRNPHPISENVAASIARSREVSAELRELTRGTAVTAAKAREIRARNHFGESLTAAMGGNHS